MTNHYSIEKIGEIHSPYQEKFAVPRQPQLVPSANCEVQLHGKANHIDTVRGLEQFSHLWLLFLFDQNIDAGWKPTVRPPRLGGNEKIGVFASRATFRPNHIGMSLVKLKSIEVHQNNVVLKIGNADLVNGTPIIDIKPYIPYADSMPDATAGYAQHPPQSIPVEINDTLAAPFLTNSESKHKLAVIKEVLAQDPRPAYKQKQLDTKEYGVALFEFNVRFKVNGQRLTVTAIEHYQN